MSHTAGTRLGGGTRMQYSRILPAPLCSIPHSLEIRKEKELNHTGKVNMIRILETNFHWIAGVMVGIELLTKYDIPVRNGNLATGGLVIDLLILRVIFIVRVI